MSRSQQRVGEKSPAGYTQGDWYDLPDYYDAVFDQGTSDEADFLEAAWHEFGGGRRKGRHDLRVLEPACGSGRLVGELAMRGHHVEGFDANATMLEAAKRRLSERGINALLREGTMEAPPTRSRFDLAHCLLSTFKYIQTDREAVNHLRFVGERLVQGGIFVLGIHLTDYGRTQPDKECWIGKRDEFNVRCETVTYPPDARRRSEKLHNRLTVRFRRRPIATNSRASNAAPIHIETRWKCRTYNATQFQKLLTAVPQLNCVACFDFNYDIDSPREFDDSQEDIVLILSKR